MRSLGYVMLHWSKLECAILDDIKRLRRVDGDNGGTSMRPRGSFSERLAEWRALVSRKSGRSSTAPNEVGEIAAQAERLRKTRDLIGNHFVGTEISAGGEYQIVVAEGGPSSVRASQTTFTTRQLSNLVEEMDEAAARVVRVEGLMSK